jgi:hypothetical protein
MAKASRKRLEIGIGRVLFGSIGKLQISNEKVGEPVLPRYSCFVSTLRTKPHVVENELKEIGSRPMATWGTFADFSRKSREGFQLYFRKACPFTIIELAVTERISIPGIISRVSMGTLKYGFYHAVDILLTKLQVGRNTRSS